MPPQPLKTRPSRAALYAAAVVLLGIGLAGAPRAESAPAHQRMDAIFVLDNSGSMRRNDPDRITHKVVMEFAGSLGRGSRLGLVVFDADARLVLPLTRAVGPGHLDQWREVLSQVDYTGQLTNSPDGIERALYELKTKGRADADRAIVFITDGLIDTGDAQRDADKKRWLRESLAADAQRAGVRIYGIAFTEEADVELIQALALGTGADYYRVPTAADIGDVLTRIGESLASRPAESEPGPAPAPVAAQPAPPPPVAAAPRDRTRGLVLLGLGLAVGALVLLYPVVQRRRRLFGAASASALPARMLMPADLSSATSRPSARPIARLVDVGNVSSDGLLPIVIERRRTSIGRDESNDIVIRRDTISSFHATIDFEDGYFYVEDHRSTNGCFLNGEQLGSNTPVQLKSGDCIDFATFEFRFIIPDHEPRGKTVVLDGTGQPEPLAPHESPPAPGAGPDPGAGEVTSWRSAFESCLAGHLDKIRAVGPEHRDFVERHFTPELCEILSLRAAGLTEEALADGKGHEVDLSCQRVHYTLCVLPEPIEGAAHWYQSEHGGYAKLLVSLLESRAGTDRHCDAVCVVTFGMRDHAWISVTLVPAQDGADAVEVMSFEFLSEEERRRALSLDIVSVGRGS